MELVESKVKVVFLGVSECGRGKQNIHFLHWIFSLKFLHFLTRRIWEQISLVNCADTEPSDKVSKLGPFSTPVLQAAALPAVPTNRPWPRWGLGRAAEQSCKQMHRHRGGWRCSGSSRGGGEAAGAGHRNCLCWCCCQRIRFVEVWLHRSVGSGHLALVAGLLTRFRIAFTQDFGYSFSLRKEGPRSFLAKYRICEVEGAMVQSSDWRCEIDLPKLDRDHTVCVLLALQYMCPQAYICI